MLKELDQVACIVEVNDQEIKAEAEKRHGKPYYSIGDPRHDHERAIVFAEGAKYARSRGLI